MDVRTTDDIRKNPIMGDVLLTKDFPPGTPLQEIDEFEVWDGTKWISSIEAGFKMYLSTSL